MRKGGQYYTCGEGDRIAHAERGAGLHMRRGGQDCTCGEGDRIAHAERGTGLHMRRGGQDCATAYVHIRTLIVLQLDVSTHTFSV